MSARSNDDDPLDCVGCCVCPHGRRSTIWAIVFCMLSYSFLCAATFGCDFMRIDGHLSSEPPYVYKNSLDLSTSKIGLFAFQDYGYGVAGTNFMCTRYEKPQIEAYFDGTFKMARGFAIMANMSVFVASLVVLVATCASVHRLILKSAGALLILGGVFMLLMFVFFASDTISDDPHNRRIGWGSGFNIIAMVLSAIAGIIVMRLDPAQPSPDNVNTKDEESQPATAKEQPLKKKKKTKKRGVMPPGVETVEETILPDGSRKYTTTKWNKDGSPTKTEDIVPPP